MIVDIQGWKLGPGQYIMTDPIIFSYERFLLGQVDWSTKGMNNWLKHHQCNEICKVLPQTINEKLTERLMKYTQQIKEKAFEIKIMEELKLISE